MQALLPSVPPALQQPPLIHTSTRDSWTLPGKSGSVSRGVTAPFSWVLMHKVLLHPPRVYFLVVCKFWQLYGGVNGNIPKRAYVIPMSAVLRAPVPAADHRQLVPPQEMLKHSSVSVSVGSLGPGVHKVCLSSLSISSGNGI